MTTEQTLANVKRQRVDHKKEWYIDQWSIERVRAHAAECRAINAERRVKELESQSLFQRIFRRSK
jgi:hypothetical protein